MEATNADGIEFGQDRLVEYLRNVRGMDTERFADFLFQNLLRWRGTPNDSFDDDVTLMVVDVL